LPSFLFDFGIISLSGEKNKITVFALAVSNLGGSVLLPIANHSSENVKWLLFFLDKNGYKRWGAV
jgi:hypothetical protein